MNDVSNLVDYRERLQGLFINGSSRTSVVMDAIRIKSHSREESIEILNELFAYHNFETYCINSKHSSLELLELSLDFLLALRQEMIKCGLELSDRQNYADQILDIIISHPNFVQSDERAILDFEHLKISSRLELIQLVYKYFDDDVLVNLGKQCQECSRKGLQSSYILVKEHAINIFVRTSYSDHFIAIAKLLSISPLMTLMANNYEYHERTIALMKSLENRTLVSMPSLEFYLSVAKEFLCGAKSEIVKDRTQWRILHCLDELIDPFLAEFPHHDDFIFAGNCWCKLFSKGNDAFFSLLELDVKIIIDYTRKCARWGLTKLEPKYINEPIMGNFLIRSAILLDSMDRAVPCVETLYKNSNHLQILQLGKRFVKAIQDMSHSQLMVNQILELFWTSFLDFISGKFSKPQEDPFFDKFLTLRPHVYSKDCDFKVLVAPCIKSFVRDFWSATKCRFSRKQEIHWNWVIQLGHKNRCIDQVHEVLSHIEPSHLEDYVEHIKNPPKPMTLQERCEPKSWYCLNFQQAIPEIRRVLYPIVGAMEIQAGKDASTNGQTIFLPEYIDNFSDSYRHIHQNRNMSYMVALALHESAHIIGGTFRFDFMAIARSKGLPALYKTIFNIIEDIRIEKLLVHSRLHFQAEDLLKFLNGNFNHKFNSSPRVVKSIFLPHQIASGVMEDYSLPPHISGPLPEIYHQDLYHGPYRSFSGLMHVWIDSCKKMDFHHPLEAYRVSEIFYEIVSLWPMNEIATLLDRDLVWEEIVEVLKGQMNPQRGEPSKEDKAKKHVIFPQSLGELYQSFLTDPRGFLEQYELTRYPAPPINYGKAKEDETEKPSNASDSQEDLEEDSPIKTDYSRRTEEDDKGGLNMQEGKTSHTCTSGGRLNRLSKIKSNVKPDKKSFTRLDQCKEFILTGIDHDFMNVHRHYSSIRQQLTRTLQRMMPRLGVSRRLDDHCGEIDMEELLNQLADRKSRDGFFLEYDEPTVLPPIQVIIGLDASGSTGTSLASSHAPTVLALEKHFAILLAEAFNTITTDIQVLAFNSITSTNIYRANTCAAISKVLSDNGSRDGDFIRYVHHLFKQSFCPHQHFFMLSDGQPCAENYGGEEALKDTLSAINEIVENGIKFHYLNIDQSTVPYLGDFARVSSSMYHLSNPDMLLKVIPKLVLSVVKNLR